MISELPQDAVFYDNSTLDSFRACPRKYFYRHVKNWTPDVISHNLVFGLCWHAAMDVVWESAKISATNEQILAAAMLSFMEEWFVWYPLERDQAEGMFGNSLDDDRFPKTPGRAKDMLHHYIRTKRQEIAKYELLGVEEPFIVPLTVEDSRLFYIGRNDKVYRHYQDNKVRIVDHKTTKSDAQGWQDTFCPNSQVDGYLFHGTVTYGDDFWGMEIDGALCQKGSTKTARFDFPPGIGFTTVPIQRQLGFVESWLWDTQYLIKSIEAHERMLASCKPTDDYLQAFEKHTTACGYFAGCEYRNLCKFYENPLRFEGEDCPRGYKVEKWVPFNVLDVTKVAKESGVGE
jgi:hypothetical protein